MQPYLGLPPALETSSAARRPAAGWKPSRPGMPLGREIRRFTTPHTTVSAGVRAPLKASPSAAEPRPPPSSGGLGPPTGAVLNVTLGLAEVGNYTSPSCGHLHVSSEPGHHWAPLQLPPDQGTSRRSQGCQGAPPPGSSISAQLRLVHTPRQPPADPPSHEALVWASSLLPGSAGKAASLSLVP